MTRAGADYRYRRVETSVPRRDWLTLPSASGTLLGLIAWCWIFAPVSSAYMIQRDRLIYYAIVRKVI